MSYKVSVNNFYYKCHVNYKPCISIASSGAMSEKYADSDISSSSIDSNRESESKLDSG